MTCAIVDEVLVSKIFDKKYESGVKKAARSSAEAAIKGPFKLEVPKDKDTRFWAVDLDLKVSLDAKTKELVVSCGVLVNIKQGSKKFLHASKPPNAAKAIVDPAKLTQAIVDGLVKDGVDVAIQKPVATMKADAGKL